jgi:hypothetical protein
VVTAYVGDHVLVGADRQGRRRDGNHDQVNSTENLLADFGQAGRTVEDDSIVVRPQRTQQLAQALRRLFFDKLNVELTQRYVGREQI